MRFVVRTNYLFAQLNDRLGGNAAMGAGTGQWAAGSSWRIKKVSAAPTVVSALPAGDLEQKVTDAA